MPRPRKHPLDEEWESIGLPRSVKKELDKRRKRSGKPFYELIAKKFGIKLNVKRRVKEPKEVKYV